MSSKNIKVMAHHIYSDNLIQVININNRSAIINVGFFLAFWFIFTDLLNVNGRVIIDLNLICGNPVIFTTPVSKKFLARLLSKFNNSDAYGHEK